MNSKPKILVFGDSVCAHTGFGTVNREIFLRLRDKYNIVFLGQNCDGSPLPEHRIFNIFPCNQDPYGRDKFPGMLNIKPDLLWTTNDFDALMWVPQHLIRARNQFNINLPWIYYFPIDSEIVHKQYTEFLKNYVDYPITVTEFGQKSILETDPDFHIPYLYHGTDSNFFRKLDPDAPLNQTGVTLNNEKERLGLKDKFVVLAVGVNQMRKGYGILLEVFAEFAKDKPDAILHLHTSAQLQWGWDMNPIINYLSEQNVKNGHLSLDNRVRFTTGITHPIGVPKSDLLLIYNLADVFALTSLGEGFCLPAAEAACCEIPILTHNCSSLPEVVGPGGILVDTEYHYWFPFGDRALRRPIPNKQQLIDGLNELYEDKSLRKKLGKKGREHIVSDVRFSWDYVAQEANKYIEKALEKNEILDLDEAEIL